jgi:N-acetylglucosamine-6-sulfatase
VMSIDDAVGGIVDTLQSTDRMDNTLFIYLTDNGLLHGEHRLMAKNLPYRRATSIPLLIRWDGHIARNSTDWRFALNVDLAQTISAATGLGLRTDGHNLLGHVKRSGFPLEGGPWRHGSGPPRHPAYCGYRTHRWMYAQYASGDRELYDYRHDPQELTNVARDPRKADVVRRLRTQTRQTCRPTPPEFSWSRSTASQASSR